jgi:glycosyltransferase involved in cell wall biosynthesis
VRQPGRIERLAQVRRLLRAEGAARVAARALDRASRRLAPPGLGRLPVTRADLAGASQIAAAGWKLPPPLPLPAGDPLTVAWLTTPPQAGSGGHTTMFRMVSALERAGHRCVVYLHDPNAWSLHENTAVIRAWWPSVQAEVRDGGAGIEDAHAVFATGWTTAYPVLASPARGVRFYLVQDFEPWFYPAGTESLLAEATYRFGFHGITAGRYLAQRLRHEYGMAADHFDFGCDLDVYALDRSPGAAGRRAGVCYYCRPSTPRRAFDLAVAALEMFAARHPEVEIHTFGGAAAAMPFAVTDHGKLAPDELNRLYNRCVAGLALSATNVSLVPQEMLAAGCIPVVNDAVHNRVVLDNAEVAYAHATPFELADALAAVVERPAAARAAAAEAAAASVQGASWGRAGADVERVVRERVEAALSTTTLAA